MEDDIIKQFLTQYKLWVDAGCWMLDAGPPEKQDYQDNEYYFSTGTGLCSNLVMFVNKVYVKGGVKHRVFIEGHHEFAEDALLKLKRRFQIDGLDEDYPFGRNEYLNDTINRSFHLNPIRMAWVNQQIKEGV